MFRFKDLLLAAALASVLVVVLLCVPLPAQPARTEGVKKALLVGVNEYANRKLPNLKYAERDMTELADVLQAAGFQVTLLLGSGKGNREATRENIDAALDELLKGTGKKDTLLLAFSGHGQQFTIKENGVSKEVPFFCGKDAAPTDAATLISLSAVLRKLDDKGGGHNLLLVDACRNDPDPNRGARGGIDGSRVENLGEGTGVFFACSKQQKARETEQAGGGHGVFFHRVLQGLKGAPEASNGQGEVTWERLIPYVKEGVKDDFPGWFPTLADDERQRPHAIGNLVDDPILIPKAMLAKTSLSATTGMKFVLIPRGRFQMGSPKEEKEHSDDEELHAVEITKPFYLGVYAVTRGQFRKFMEDSGHKTDAETDGKGGEGWTGTKWKQDPKYSWKDPGFTQSDEHPVVNVSWNDATAFCDWLSRKDRKKYRLPTEAQWEYACRAGTQTRFHFGDDEEDLAKYGNVADASFRAATKTDWGIKADDGYAFTAPVGKFKANGFGLYDMHGNVWQWCLDYYGPYKGLDEREPARTIKHTEDQRVLRGGSWSGYSWNCRAAYRFKIVPYGRGNNGFRVCLPLD